MKQKHLGNLGRDHPSTVYRLFAFSAVSLALLFSLVGPVRAATPSLDSDYPIQYQNDNYKTSEQSTGSGVTYWPSRTSYLLLDNTVATYGSLTGSRLIEYGTNNSQVREIVLVGFQDPEDIHWISGNTFVIAQEYNTGPSPDSENELVVIDIPTSGTSVNISSSTRRLKLPSLGGNRSNLGVEAVALIGSTFYFTTEKPPNASDPSTWKVWTVPNSGSGNVTPTLTVAFTFPNPMHGNVTDISGMATDGTDLWLLSHEGDGSPPGHILKLSTSGSLLAEYELPTFTGGGTWSQAEGIELFIDPFDSALKILLSGEDGSASGTDFMRLTKQAVTITANDPAAAEPEGATTYPGQFTVTRNINPNSSLNVTFSTAGSTATSGSDYTSIGTSVTIGANNYTATIDVSPIDDSAYEPDETVIATLTSSANYSISAAQPATVIIQSIFELKGTGGTYASEVYAVNDNGQAVGDLGRHNADGSFGESYSFVPYGINNAGNVVGPGYAKIGGTTHNLGSFNGLSINNNNSVCGWDSGYVYYLTYSGGSFSSPNLIGDGWSGDIDVWYDVNNPYDVITGASLPNSYYYHPYYGWPGTLPSATGSSLAYPMGINSSGDVVGVEEVAWEDPQPGEPAVIDVGVLWSSGGYYSTPTLLTSFPAGVSNYCGSFPYKINSSGVIVGRIQDVTWRAGIWLSGQWYYLDDVIGDANWTFGNAYDISNNGHIVGTGAHNNQGRCFVIRP